MWLKEIIVDGFKSYANRTVISGFDRSFNAITGLNGSGKSNILDAICFVLGITNLSAVRVHSLNELIYKAGQSRVNKASVTLLFDNSDKAQSPIGYEDLTEISICRQIAVGGKTKYLLNGHLAMLSRVQHLLHSVQLNVNNPHFLIMQGRITKVINMKAVELLAMLEESAGTKMFENKKQIALKTIIKKQTKVNEINNLLEEEILPTLTRLRNEKQSLQHFNDKKGEVEKLQRICILLQYRNLISSIIAMQESHTEMGKTIQEAQNDIQSINSALARKETDIKQSMKSLKSSFHDELAELEARASDHSKQIVQVTSQLSYRQESLKEEEKDQQRISQSISSLIGNLMTREGELKKCEEQQAEDEKILGRIQEKINSLQSQQLGISLKGKNQSGGGGDAAEGAGGTAGQLMVWQRKISEFESQLKQLAMQKQHLKQQLAEKKDAISKQPEGKKEFRLVQSKVEKNKRSLQELQNKLNSAKQSYDNHAKKQCENSLQLCEEQLQSCKAAYNSKAVRLSSFDTEPFLSHPSVKASSIKGMVGSLFHVKDAANMKAIEVTAGGKLFNLVVDSDATAKSILENIKLKKRITILPLNQIRGGEMPPQVEKFAKELVGENNVDVALSLISFDSSVKPALAFIFNSTLICTNLSVATKVAFHPNIKKKCITVEGDMIDPRGIMEGGKSQGSLVSILAELSEWNLLKEKKVKLETEYQSLQTKLAEYGKLEVQIQSLQSQYDIQSSEINCLETQLQASGFSEIQIDIESLQTEISACETKEKDIMSLKKEAQETCNDLQAELNDKKSARNDKISRAEKESKSLQTSYEKQQKAMKANYIKISQLQNEISSMQVDIESSKDSLQTKNQLVASLKEEIVALTTDISRLKLGHEDKLASIKSMQTKMAQHDSTLATLQKEKAALLAEKDEIELECKKNMLAFQRFAEDENEIKRQIKELEKRHDWAKEGVAELEQESFNKDYGNLTPASAQAKLSLLQQEVNSLGNRINTKVLGMFEKTEAECKALMDKRSIILADKEKIEKVINDLDVKKLAALEFTYNKVRQNLQSIMSTLLPGVHATLVPAGSSAQAATTNSSTMSQLQLGVEMKVAFNGVWKESLSELSGGQRSLLALSFILALLLFKPAPMYILDEIDSALDLSHTQNIGSMLRTHFPQSQFIIVSLKEGMFNHANVLFRAKFGDGVSAVQRTAVQQQQPQPHHQPINRNKEALTGRSKVLHPTNPVSYVQSAVG